MLILAKSRLAPLKERLLTIPKLELQAAVIAARMKETVLDEISFQPREIFLWTDSKTVIRYIQNEKGHFPMFVKHRINEMKQLSKISDWHYIPNEQNPADLCTRTHTDFKSIQQKWFYGPETIHQKILDLKEINTRNQFEENSGINIGLTTHNSKSENCNTYQIIKWDSYSSWNKLVRHVALLVKIKQNWVNSKRKSNSKVNFSRLSPDEFQNAKMILCRVAHLESYPEEYNQLKYNKEIPKNSSLLPFKPFMHESLIRVGRRIKHADLPFNIKHQIIIHHKH